MLCRYANCIALVFLSLLLLIPLGFLSADADQTPASSSTPQTEQSQPSPERTAPLTLTLGDAVKRGLQSNATVQASNARVQAANARLRAAVVQQNPFLTLAHGWGNSNTAGLDEDIILAQVFTLGVKHSAPIRAAMSERDAAVMDKRSVELSLTLTIETAYLSAVQANHEYANAEKALRTAQAFANAARIRFEAGDVARDQVVRSQIEVNTAQQALTNAAGARVNRETELKSLLGVPKEQAVDLTESLSIPQVSCQLSSLINYGLANRPDLRSTQLLVEARRFDVRAARALSTPDAFIEL